MTNIILLDDERKALENVKKALLGLQTPTGNEFNILGEFQRVKGAETAIKKLWDEIDLIIIDIQLEFGILGTKFLKTLLDWAKKENKNVNFKVIIVTNHNKYIKAAFNLSGHVLHYVDKIALEDELKVALEKYFKKVDEEQQGKEAQEKLYQERLHQERLHQEKLYQERLYGSLLNIINIEDKTQYLLIPFKRKLLWLCKEDIFYIKGAAQYTEFYLVNKAKKKFSIKTKSLLINGSFGDWLKKLLNFDGKRFVQVHRSYLVNLDYVIKSKASSLILCDPSLGNIYNNTSFLREIATEKSITTEDQMLLLLKNLVQSVDKTEEIEIPIGNTYAVNIDSIS